jgi:ADP-ribose pyrophosphatase YjhB (NUDIX family)
MAKIKRGSGIVPIASNTKNICLAWRSMDVNEGNRWGVIGGMVKDGLTVEQGALLEMKEEVGYTGPINLHRAFVKRRPGFEYHNFIGIVPEQFQFQPEAKYAWETSFISWMPYKTICELMESDSHTFHAGLLDLFRQSKELIESLL